MGATRKYFREQCRVNKFTLEHEDASDFYLSCLQTNRSTVPLLCIRLVLFFGSVAILVSSLVLTDMEGRIGYWLIYMTNWGVCMITVVSGLAFAVSATAYVRGPIDSTFGLPWYLKLYWAAYNTGITVALFITIFYYALLYDAVREQILRPALDVFVHGINSVVMFLLLATARHPSHMLHFTQPLALALVYMAFSLIYYYAGGVNALGDPFIYPLLDWRDPGVTTAIIFACAGFLVLLHVFMVLASLLRDYLSKKYVRNFNTVLINK